MLTARQARFVTEYYPSGNGTRAAIAAGYAAGSADVTACRLLGNERVSAALAERQAEATPEYGITRASFCALQSGNFMGETTGETGKGRHNTAPGRQFGTAQRQIARLGTAK